MGSPRHTYYGTDADETIRHNKPAAHTYMYGIGGNNYLINETDMRAKMQSRDGNDYFESGAGNDEMDGGSGNDTMYGGAGNDDMDGDSGNDTMYGGDGDDDMEGGMGNDEMYGGSGNDDMEGGMGNNEMYGGSGNDNMRANNHYRAPPKTQTTKFTIFNNKNPIKNPIIKAFKIK